MKLEGIIGIGAISLSALGVATTAEPLVIVPVDPVTRGLMILNAISAAATAIAFVVVMIRKDRRESRRHDKDKD